MRTSIDAAGTWSPGAPIAVPVSGRTFTIDIPAASAALVRAE
jgi:hypothetical protein